MVGAERIPPSEVWRSLWGGEVSDPVRSIVLYIRLPRVLGGVLTGACLALSGMIFQALLRNPLAEPFLLGVSSGAALGAVLSITILGGFGTVGLALGGALLAIALVFRAGMAAGRLDRHVLILAGVAVSAFFAAAVMLLFSFAEANALRAGVLWTMGSLERIDWDAVATLGVVVAIGGVTAFALARHLNAFALGEEAAGYLGIPVERVKRVAFFVASLLAAASVASAGAIGFVGLVVPHAVRILWGSNHRTLVPLGAIGGGAAVVVADAMARTALRPMEIPIGVVTAIVGVPLFLVLLRRMNA